MIVDQLIGIINVEVSIDVAKRKMRRYAKPLLMKG